MNLKLSASAVAILLITAGCNNSSMPFLPSSPSENQPVNQSAEPSSHAVNNHAIWGMFWIILDGSQGSYEVIPDRQGLMHLNIRRFLEDGAPCANCLQILSITPGPSNTKNVEIMIKHPWSNSPTYTAFDVRGIAMWNGTEFWESSGLRTQNPDGTDGYVLNADGYTTIFNPVDFPPGSGSPIFTYNKGKFATPAFPNSTLNPFIDYYTNSNRRMFGSGQSVIKTWQIRLPSAGPFVLGYAVDACWEPPTTLPPKNVPDDFPIAANRPEPYKVEFQQLNPLEPSTGAIAQVEVYIWDWQKNAGSAWIECPALWSGLIKNDSISWDGTKMVAHFSIKNEKGAPAGTYRALIGAEDEIVPSPPGDYTTYKFTEITVEKPANHPPVAAASSDQTTAYTGEPIKFQSLSFDPDGSDDIASLKWDFTNDGIWDYAYPNPQWIYYVPGKYYVDHQVTDKGNLSDDLEPDELLEITIYDNCCKNPPEAYAEASAVSVLVNEFITLTSHSIDPDGAYCLKSWGWDFDGKPGIDVYGEQVNIVYYQPGIYQVQHEIVDNCDLKDTLDKPIIIEVMPDCCQLYPVAKFSDPPGDILKEQKVVLTNQSYDPESPKCSVKIYWDLDDDGSFDDGSDEEVVLSWDQVGKYYVSLKAVDECGLESVYSVPVTVHVGITYSDDASFKIPNTRYSYISGDYEPVEAAFAVDLNDPDGPWDFTSLTLKDIGTHKVTLKPSHPEVKDFYNDFPASYEHFQKSAGIYLLVKSPLYMAEEFMGNPDRLVWVGLHENVELGSKPFNPTIKMPYPFWIFTNLNLVSGMPPIFLFNYSLKGYAEGTVKVPYDNGKEHFCLIMRSEMSITTPIFSRSTLVYEFVLDDGLVVAIISATNNENEINYDKETKTITGIATYNALKNIGPY